MSWNPFSRHSVPKRSVLSRTAEREFERDVKKLEELEEITKKLHKDMKRCLELRSASEKAEHRISQDLLLSTLCQNEENFCRKLERWDQSQEKLASHMHELNSCGQKTVVEPMKKYGSIFPSLQNAVRKREQSLQEYSKSQAKLEKYRERDRTGQNVVKLQTSQKSLSFARDDFENQNSALIEDMPKLFDGRTDYFQPCLQALIKAQVTHNKETFQIYDNLCDCFQQIPGEGAESTSNRVQQTLSDIKALSITVDD